METSLHFISAIIILLSALIPIYLTVKLKSNKKLKKLTLILSIFILIHAVYHIAGFFGFNLLADGFLEPLSASILIFFGIVYSGMSKSRKNMMSMKNTMAAAVVSLAGATTSANNNDTLLLLMNSVTIILLLIALGMFLWLAARSRNVRTFQFQLSIFIVIWIVGDIVSILNDNGIIVFSYAPILQGNVGSEIHVVSMVFFSMMLCLRFYYSERSGQKILKEDMGVSDISTLK